MIAATRRKLQSEINKSVANYWLSRITAIDPRKLAGLDAELLEKDDSGTCIIREDKTKANLLAAHYMSVNNQNEGINNCTFRNLVDSKVNSLLDEIALTHPDTVCTFSENNNTLKP
ncbi:hypothetical protein M0802_016721 [Mischocyttarus mexicanus]|nr:hypothetical protein M0802_016721 [Mischocyttarus mexicanus]